MWFRIMETKRVKMVRVTGFYSYSFRYTQIIFPIIKLNKRRLFTYCEKWLNGIKLKITALVLYKFIHNIG